MGTSQIYFWAGVAVLIVIGACVGLGIVTHSAWVPVLTITGIVIAYRGSIDGTSKKITRFVIFSLVGIILIILAIGIGCTGELPTSGWRWLWTPVWLFISLAPFIVGYELVKKENTAGVLGYSLGFLCLAAAIATPLVLPKLPMLDLPSIGKSTLPNNWWVAGVLLSLTCSTLALWYGLDIHPGRFSLFAVATIILLAGTTYALSTPIRWQWAVIGVWLYSACLIYSGAKDIKVYREWIGYLGYGVAVLGCAGAVLGIIWYSHLNAQPGLVAEAPVPTATLAPTLASTQIPEPTVIVQAAEAPGAEGAQPPREIGFVWKFLVKAFTSRWGIFPLLIILLLGEMWIKRWGEPLFLAVLLVAAWYFGSASPEAQAAWLSWISSSPASWMRSILDGSIERFNTPGIGILFTGLALVIMLFPATRILFQVNQAYLDPGVRNRRMATTAVLDYMNQKGVSQGRLSLAGILNVGLLFGTAISLWSALQSMLKTGAYPASKLGFLFIPNLAVPSFKPVWQWSYFALAGIAWLTFVILIRIQRRYTRGLQYVGCQQPSTSLVMLMVSATWVPAGVMLLSAVFLVSQWLVLPLSFLKVKPLESKPRVQPVRRPQPKPAYKQQPSPPNAVPKPQPSPPPAPPPTPPPEPIKQPEITILPIQITDTPSVPEMIGREVFALPGPLVGLVVNDQGQCLVLARNGSLGLYEDGESKITTKIDLAAPVGLACAARGELAAIGRNGRLLVLQLSGTGFEVVREGALSIPVRSYALNPFGTLLACCHPDMSKVCGVFLGKMEETAFSDQVENPTGLSFSSDGRYLAIGSETGSVHIFDISTRQPTRVLEVMDTDLEGPALQVAGFKKDGQPCWLVTYQNQQVGLWNAAGALVGQTKLSFTAECLAVDVVREKFAVGGAEGQLEVYSAGLLQEIAGQVHAGKLIHLAFDRSSGQLFSAGSDNCVKEIDI